MINGEFDEHGHETDTYSLQEQLESIEDSNLELRKINSELISLEDTCTGELEERRPTLERLLRTLKANVSRLAGSKEEKPPLTASGVTGMSSIQFPKIEVLTFDGNVLNWRIFWEQFDSAIRSKSQLTDSDKLTYLREELKSGPVNNVVVELTQTSENYNEAVRCLQKRYDRVRVLYQVHIR